MPRIYDDSSVTIGASTVHVRQVMLTALPATKRHVVGYAKQIVETGQQLVANAIRRYPGWLDNIFFLQYFDPEHTDMQRLSMSQAEAADHRRGLEASADAILLNCIAILSGMGNEHSIKIADLEAGTLGRVATYPHHPTRRRGDIHIARWLIVRNEWDKAVITYIHEASHRFANTIDHGGKGYMLDNGNYSRRGLTMAEARLNADSYAWFLWSLAPTALKWAVPQAPPL